MLDPKSWIFILHLPYHLSWNNQDTYIYAYPAKIQHVHGNIRRIPPRQGITTWPILVTPDFAQSQ
jgi:hypothetical protein